MEHDDLPLQVGERVKYDNHGAGAGASGIIVERLRAEYLRVFWSDSSLTTTHRCHSLKRAADTKRQEH
jgi:hypothetical protein